MEYQERKASLLLYTREVRPEDYPDGLARSIHLAYSWDGRVYQALHQNYGILFAPGTISGADTICPKGVKNPRAFALPGGGYGIVAERVEEDGSEDAESRGKVLCWTTEDFVEFRFVGLVEQAAGAETGHIAASIPEGAIPGGCVEIGANLCDRIVQRWSRIYNTEVRVPDCIRVRSAGEVAGTEATAVYSDGSTSQKKVRWETDGIDFGKKGTYEISGTVQNRAYPFPVARGYGDPVILPWKGRYYFIATNDNTDDVGLYVRVADDVAGLFGLQENGAAQDAKLINGEQANGTQVCASPKAGVQLEKQLAGGRKQPKEHLILGRDAQGRFWQTFWAPEFHVIGGELYILFAVSDRIWGPQCHLMRLKKGGDIINPEDWEEPVRIRRKDGSVLCTREEGITLDMTYLWAGGRSYVIWSYRRHIGTPADTGSMLYIATVDERAPWQLTSDPVLLTRPLLGWENVSGTINNEGPYSFVKDGRVYLTYSGGSANSYTYVLGLLTAAEDDDLLCLSSWKKSGVPVLSFYSVDGEYGPGHNSFFTDDLGNLMIAYHAEDALDHVIRCDGIRRVHFAIDGRPVFDLSAERDLNPALREVKMRVEVCGEDTANSI